MSVDPKRARRGSRRAARLGLAGLIGAWGFAAPAAGGSFRVNPVQINLPADRQAASLSITNSDAAPVSIRVLTYAWTQAGGRDVYAPTGNVIASPPIFTIQPGKTQLIRLGLKDRALASAYRVIFEEIPRDVQVAGQIQVTLRLDLPLYLLPKEGGKPQLSWRAWRNSAGELFVEGRNSGSLHGQVLELAAEQNGKRHLLSREMGVVLPSNARLWNIGKRPEIQAGAPIALKVRGPTGDMETELLLEQR